MASESLELVVGCSCQLIALGVRAMKLTPSSEECTILVKVFYPGNVSKSTEGGCCVRSGCGSE